MEKHYMPKQWKVAHHRGLIAKLKVIGVDGNVLKWIENYLTDRELRVTVGGKTSTSRVTNAGVPQGSILGPLLFLIYIDDLTERLTNTAILYADDSSVMNIIKERRERARAALSLNTDLQKIQNWAESWNVLFGATKCKCLTVSNLRDAVGNHPELSFMDTPLAEVEEAELLGVTIRKELTWTHHIKQMATDAGKRLGLLRRVAPYLSPQQRATIYKSMVRSCMEYASTVWMGASDTSLDLLDAIQRRATRIINLPQAELDRNQIQPLKQRRQVGALTLLHRMYNQDAPALLISLLPTPYVHRRETRLSRSQHSNALEPVKSSTTSHRRTFLPATVQLWNSLPQDIVALKDRHKFKSSVNRHLSGIGQRPCDSC
ncbi:hypothetical protein Bbelb_236050 [Branchiostoma belcheri]|nr:hypothetical protein Bbelb_236050 [Branchiostoma belcheri]